MQINNSKSKINFNNLSSYFNLSSELQYDFSSMNGITKADGVIAILFWVYTLVLTISYSIIIKKSGLLVDLNKSNGMGYKDVLYALPCTIIYCVTIVVILIFRKQSFSTVLINGKNILKCILLGFVISLPVIVIKLLNNTLNNNNEFVWPLIHYLINVSFIEELIIRGFIQPRILVLIKNKAAAFFIVGWMWGILHIPIKVAITNQSALYFFLQEPLFMGFVVSHVLMVYLATRFNSIIPAVIFHFFLDV